MDSQETAPDSVTVRLWSLRDDALVEDGARPGALVIVTPRGEETVETPGAAIAESLRRMAFGPASLRNALDASGAAAQELTDRVRLVDGLGGAAVHSLPSRRPRSAAVGGSPHPGGRAPPRASPRGCGPALAVR